MRIKGGEATRFDFVAPERFSGFEVVYQQAEKQRSWKAGSDHGESKKKKGLWIRLLKSLVPGLRRIEKRVPAEKIEECRISAGLYL